MLLSGTRAEADEPRLGEVAEDVETTRVVRRDAGLVPDRIQGVAPHALPPLHRAFGDSCTAREDRVVQLELSVPAASTRDDSWREQRQHPARVFGGDEVQRTAHGPGAN